jgi:hypothetical protein
MGKYQMDMNGEDKTMFEMPDGWHDFEIVKVEEQTSKSGNQMFVAKVVSADDASIGTDVYLIAEKGKRWFLKQLLKACDCAAGEDGVYDWSEEDIEGATVQGRVEHKQEDDWTDRSGKTQPGKLKARIVEFKKLEI